MSETIYDFPVMKGNANMAVGAGYFEVPLFSHIKDNLWMGCSPAEFPDEHEQFNYDFRQVYRIHFVSPVHCHWLLEHVEGEDDPRPRFNKIINLFQWGEYQHPRATDVFTFEMFDGDQVDSAAVDLIAARAIELLEYGYRVLIHCQAGLNRSSLVVARVLMLRDGMTADEAITTIREKRSPVCLCNPNFEAWLRAFDDKLDSE